ncbi:hypothetical protein PSACC_01367 [Paramicrosporidium saccamoebae]|uniref:Uncharacterized protein n=1 Tax=Paramicrosporidium saccamoebae TaxID=1246581 RepID=A0A2H9TM84_9FUNG|nr:hypothetical protein PSACC_01367 [Paramicrosporidium saccamoebae]
MLDTLILVDIMDTFQSALKEFTMLVQADPLPHTALTLYEAAEMLRNMLGAYSLSGDGLFVTQAQILGQQIIDHLATNPMVPEKVPKIDLDLRYLAGLTGSSGFNAAAAQIAKISFSGEEKTDIRDLETGLRNSLVQYHIVSDQLRHQAMLLIKDYQANKNENVPLPWDLVAKI